MFLTIGRLLVIFLSVTLSTVYVSGDEVYDSINEESNFDVVYSDFESNFDDADENFQPNMHNAGIKELRASLRKYAMKMDSFERAGNLITLYPQVVDVGDMIRHRGLQQLSEGQEKSLQAMKDDSRLLEFLLRNKILTLLMDTAEQFVDDLNVVMSSALIWIPRKIVDLRVHMNDLKNEIWWLRKVNVMEYVQNIHKRLMRILVMTENISEISSSAVIENILSKIRNFVRNQVNRFLDAAY